jgi:hypothetical protein
VLRTERRLQDVVDDWSFASAIKRDVSSKVHELRITNLSIQLPVPSSRPSGALGVTRRQTSYGS